MKDLREQMEWVLDNGKCGPCRFHHAEAADHHNPACNSCELLDNFGRYSDKCPNLEDFEEAVLKKMDTCDVQEVVQENWEALSLLITDFYKDHKYSDPYHTAKIRKAVETFVRETAEGLI